jgi:hypothetical protein
MKIARACLAATLSLSACATALSHTASDHAAILASLAGPLQQAETDCIATIPAQIGSYVARAQCINNAYDRLARAVYPFPVLLDRAEQSRLNFAHSVDEGRRTPQEAEAAQASYDRVIASAEREQLGTDQYQDEQDAAQQREESARRTAAALLIFSAAAAAAYHPPPPTVTTHCTTYGSMTDCTTQ